MQKFSLVSVMKFRPPDYPTDPNQEQWSRWKQCFVDGLIIYGIAEDCHKLTFLRSYTG